jgi:hypothetical protein
MRLFLAFLALALLSCSGQVPPVLPPDAPSVDLATPLEGIPDGEDDPAVLEVRDEGGASCGGALLATDVVVTTQNCAPRLPQSLAVAVAGPEGRWVIRAHGAAWLLRPAGPTDIAVAQLDAPIDNLVPLAVRSTGIAEGDHVRTVGLSSAGPTPVRLVRDHVPVTSDAPLAFTLVEGFCAVRVGAFALDESSAELVGISTASRASPCAETADRDFFVRADVALSPMRQLLATHRPPHPHSERPKRGPVDVGASCANGRDCAAGACVSYAGGRYCTRACGAHDHCPARFGCMQTREGAMVCVRR